VAKAKDLNASTAKVVNHGDARIDALKEQLRSTPHEVDYERHIIMRDVYEETVGLDQMIRRARLTEATVERKGIYIDDNLFVGSITGKTNGVYPYGREDRREVEDSGIAGGQRMGARVLGQAFTEAPHRSYYQKALWL
jgi:hypothetical protein